MMPKEIFTIHIEGLEQWTGACLAAVRRGAARGIEKSVLLLENAVETKIQEGRDVRHFGPAVDTRTLLGAIFGETRKLSPEKVMGIVAVNPPADQYALVVEKGRRPGAKMPPEEPIINWMLSKSSVFGKEVRRITGFIRRGTHGRRAKEVARHITGEQARLSAAKSLSYVIRRAIGRLGIPGVHMFENTFNEQRENVQQIVREEVRAELEGLGK